jgi:glycosyltransferase involved in cell wall biosynthesis
LHTPLYEDLRARLRNAVKFGLFGRRVNGILASGPDPAAAAIRAGAPRDRVEIVGGAVETSRFTPPTVEERARFRERLSIPRATRVLLHFGWDWQLKDGDLFLASISALLDRLPGGADPVLGLTVGTDPAGRAAVKRFTPSSAVRSIDPTDDVRTLYGAADVFVSSSRVEGQPFAVIEAICSGLPVAATDLPGNRDICEGLRCCRVVERSPQALATAAAELLDQPLAEAADAGAEAQRSMASRFDLEAWSERMMGRYEAALQPKLPGLKFDRPATDG